MKFDAAHTIIRPHIEAAEKALAEFENLGGNITELMVQIEEATQEREKAQRDISEREAVIFEKGRNSIPKGEKVTDATLKMKAQQAISQDTEYRTLREEVAKLSVKIKSLEGHRLHVEKQMTARMERVRLEKLQIEAFTRLLGDAE